MRSKTEALEKYRSIHVYIANNPLCTLKQISHDLGMNYSWLSRQVKAMINQQSVIATNEKTKRHTANKEY